ncbi:MAG: ECF transporter S component [Candidatus Bathyarchaeota archaeon]|nr:ECF transporter S component [Candidatus Bathyarchaeota archaeon]
MNTHFKTQDIAVIGICSALYAVLGILTANVSFYGIGFLPAVAVPAIFAVLYGPWVGGLSGAIGIFIRDMFVHGNAALSLVAGVPANFLLFFIIGYMSHRNISLKQALAGIAVAAVGLLVPTLVFLPDFEALTGLPSQFILLTFGLTIVASLSIIALVSIRWKEWRSYAIGAVLGQIVGAGLVAVTVWLVSPLFLGYFGVPFAASLVLPLFVWTFATEVPFILLVGPPIIKVCYRAFPSLRRNQSSRDKP